MLQIAPAGRQADQAAADLGKSSAWDPSGKDDAVRRGGQTKDGRMTFFTAFGVLSVRRAAAFTSRDATRIIAHFAEMSEHRTAPPSSCRTKVLAAGVQPPRGPGWPAS